MRASEYAANPRRFNREFAGRALPPLRPKTGSSRLVSCGEHDILERLTADEAVDVARDLGPTARDHPFGPAGAVRRHDDVRQFVEGMARGAALGLGRVRVLPPDVEGG